MAGAKNCGWRGFSSESTHLTAMHDAASSRAGSSGIASNDQRLVLPSSQGVTAAGHVPSSDQAAASAGHVLFSSQAAASDGHVSADSTRCNSGFNVLTACCMLVHTLFMPCSCLNMCLGLITFFF
ncbi:hypothetical protein DUNSADRAFT_13649, partial [Dunaliella salina]